MLPSDVKELSINLLISSMEGEQVLIPMLGQEATFTEEQVED